MEFSMRHMALLTSFFGLVSFVLGVVAENKKPAAGTPIKGNGVVTCEFPSDPTVFLGYMSVLFLFLSSISGYLSLSYPYKKKSIPYGALFSSKTLVVFFNIAWMTAGLAAALLLWPVITEQLHRTRNVHHNLDYECPTAKTGLIGGAAFVSLDSCLIWLICLMLVSNAREDYFEEIEEAGKVDRTQVIDVDYDDH